MTLRDARGVQVGDGSLQINYFVSYGRVADDRLTSTDGVIQAAAR
jgi:hypothetical protein